MTNKPQAPWKHIGLTGISNGEQIIANVTPSGEFLSKAAYEAHARLIAAAPELLNSANLDHMFPITTEEERKEMEAFAENLGWKRDMPPEHFAQQYRSAAIAKTRD